MPAQRGSSDGAQLRSAMSALTQRLRREDATMSIGPTGFGLLALLLRAGPVSASELAAMAQAQPQNLTRPLKSLEDERLIGRRVDPDDRRRAMLWITPKGEDLVRSTIRKRVSWLNATIAANLSDDERETLRDALPLLEKLAGPENAKAAPRLDVAFNIVPFARVKDVARSVDFYAHLGLVVDGEHRQNGEITFASMHSIAMRTGRIMFQRASDPIDPDRQQIFFWCWTHDIETLHARLIAEGLSPGPIDTTEAGEFTLFDPDGYRISVGQVQRA